MDSCKTPIESAVRPRISPFVLLALYWVFLFIRNGFTETDRDPFYIASFTAPLFQFLGPGILLCMLLVIVLEFKHLLYREFSFYFASIAAMLSLFTVSWISNNQEPVNAVQFFFGYLQYIILIPYAILCIKSRPLDFRTITKWILIPILAQFFVNFGWALKISPLQNVRRYIPNNVDWAYGTLTNTTEVAGIGGVLIFFCFHILVFKPEFPRPLKRRNTFLLLAAGVMLLLWADSKLTYLTLSMGMAIICFLTLKASLFKKLVFTVVGFSSLAALFLGSLFYNFLFNPIYSSSVPFGKMVEWTVLGGLNALDKNPKIQVYQSISDRLSGDLDFPLFGGGPGNATSRFAIKSATPLAQKYILPEIEWELRHGNSMLMLPNTGFNSLFGDLGWLGTIFFYSTLLLPLGAIYQKFVTGGFSGLQSSWAFVYLVFTAYFVLHSFIDDKLYLGTEVAFVWIMAILLRQGERRPFAFNSSANGSSIET